MRQPLLLLPLSALLAACPSPGTSVAAPSGFHAAPAADEYVNSLELDWTPVSGATGYELQARLGDGAWETIDVEPADAIGVYLGFTADAPEATSYGFQLRATTAKGASAWSDEVRIYRGIRSATGLQVFDPQGGIGGLDVQWVLGSTQATAILVERAVVEVGGAQGTWSAVAGVGLTDVSYSELNPPGWIDGRTIAFRVTYLLNGHSSIPALASSSPARPAAPAGLATAPVGPTTIRLTWSPLSTYADRQVVTRTFRASGFAEELPELGPAVADLVDQVPSPGAWLYTVRAQVGPSGNIVNYTATSDPVLGFTAMDPAAPFGATALALPLGDQAARDSTGAFGLVRSVSQAGPMVALATIDTPGGWTTHQAPADRGLVTPAILFDPQDRPHLFTVLFATISDQPHHEWLDGAGWRAEDLPSYRVNHVAIDATGAIHAVSCDSSFAYLTNASGSWVATPLTGNVIPGTCKLGVGPQGDPRIAYGAYVEVSPGVQTYGIAWQRLETGAWVEEWVPGTDGAQRGWWDFLSVLAPSASRTALVWGSPDGPGNILVRAVVRDASAWGAAETVGSRAFDGQPESLAAAAAPDGRLLVAWSGWPNGSSTAHTTAVMRAADGGWTSTPLLDGPWGVAAGFLGGKAWVLEGLGGTSQLLYEER